MDHYPSVDVYGEVPAGGATRQRPAIENVAMAVLGPMSQLVKWTMGLSPLFVRPCVVVLGYRSGREGPELLLTQRAGHMRTYASTWVFPGGHIDPGEEPAMAATREFEEETGQKMKADELELIGTWQARVPHKLRQYIILIYAGKIENTEEPLALDPIEVQSAAWIRKDIAKLLCCKEQPIGDVNIPVLTVPEEKKRLSLLEKKTGTVQAGTRIIQLHEKVMSVASMRRGLAAGHRFGVAVWLEKNKKL
uniref:Nudix hydrolase domain-containing protein n=1 Tax=Lotharella oceanica TaxID=641309 RepID=A0A7S2XEK1_9EUKA|mmetsp:Transcript_32490/g.60453  ORF Transcript_32490/g.60453 Transcript_32490/m.60453 type:complete len:249 (+) Transcript_32490:276-1022(+)